MDDALEAEDEGAMILTGEAQRLWEGALALNAAARHVSPDPVSCGATARTLPPLLFFTDPMRTPEPWRTAGRLPAGAAVVYRHFGAADAEGVARRLRAATADRGVLLLIGLDANLAQAVGADGVHLPERAVAQATALRTARPDWLLTGAVHSGAAAQDAGSTGLDALVLSPVFTAGGASSAKPSMGLEALTQAVAAASLPVYALGGVSSETMDGLTGSGVCGIAGVDSVQRAFDPSPRT